MSITQEPPVRVEIEEERRERGLPGLAFGTALGLDSGGLSVADEAGILHVGAPVLNRRLSRRCMKQFKQAPHSGDTDNSYRVRPLTTAAENPPPSGSGPTARPSAPPGACWCS